MSATEGKGLPLKLSDNIQPHPQTVPVLGEGFQESRPMEPSSSADSSEVEEETEAGVAQDPNKLSKRRLFGFGRKKDSVDDVSKSRRCGICSW